MDERTPPRLEVPNLFGWIYLNSLEEILGQNGLVAVLNQSGYNELIDNYPAEDRDILKQPELFSQTGKALEGLYGVRGGRGVALRAGRASFKYYLKYFGPEMGLESVDFRLLPLEEKLFSGLQKLADLLGGYYNQPVTVEKEPENYFWKTGRCPYCWERDSDEPVCHFQVGLLQSALYWLSGGKYYTVQESACAAAGAETEIIRIDRSPLD